MTLSSIRPYQQEPAPIKSIGVVQPDHSIRWIDSIYVKHDIPANTWITCTTPSGRWLDIAYGNGIYVAVGFSTYGNNQIITSHNGLTWTGTANVGVNLSSVAFGNGIFVAVSNVSSGYVYTSTDGMNWEQQAAPEIESILYRIKYVRDLFIGINSQNTDNIYTSPDGINWTARTLPNSYSGLRDVCYANNTFYLVSGSNLLTSPDAITWTQNSSTFSVVQGITHGDAGFVMCTGSLQRNYYTSTDGITWTARKLSTEFKANYYKVLYANGVYGMCGSAILTSTDGINWINNTLAKTAAWNSIEYNSDNNDFVVGTSATITTNNLMILQGALRKIYQSLKDTGKISGWTQRPFGTGITSRTWQEMVYANGQLMLVGSSTTHNGTTYLTSPTGLDNTWTQHSTMITGSCFSICYSEELGKYVAVGVDNFNNTTSRAPSFMSTDGINWTAGIITNYISSGDQIRTWNKVIYANGLFVAGGNVSNSGTHTIYTSTDGINWTGRIITSLRIQDIAYGNGMFIATHGSWQSTYWYSQDGINWTVGTHNVSKSWVTFGNGKFVVAGTNSTSISVDGISWTTYTQSVSFIKMCYGNGLFVAIDGGANVYTSPDGINWTKSYGIGFQSLNKIYYAEELKRFFISYTQQSMVLTADSVR